MIDAVVGKQQQKKKKKEGKHTVTPNQNKFFSFLQPSNFFLPKQKLF